MISTHPDYQHLHDLSRHTELLSSISQLLDWDQETYMPPDANTTRSEQQKIMAGLIHKQKTGPQFAKALEKLIDIPTGKIHATGLSEPQKAALKMWRRDYIKDTALPSQFVEEFAQLSSQSQSVWRKAKKEQSFEQFAPFLDKLIAMNRKKADLLTYQDHPYDALLDLYEPELTTKKTTKLFSSLETSVSTLLKKITAAPQVDDGFLFGNFDHKKQLEYSQILLKAMGYEPSRGRLDISTHPFSSSLHPTDNRITTRIHQTSLMSNIGSVMHEAGHALYGMGLPVEQYGSPLGQAISYGIHESQSRWWETRIGKCKAFWAHYYPILQATFPEALQMIDLDTFYKGINKVQPSLIRVEADEVGYPLHVILRFHLERDLIDGTLPVRNIPEAWNQKMTELMGITPQNNSEGCLQDIHWAMGAFGYFPSYALGNIFASHLFPTFEKAHPNWKDELATGNLLFIKEWLNQNVHQYGRQYTSIELMDKITKCPFTADAYIDYLNQKYSEIYAL
ncbi:MAG: carboxypeptidase M32 [Parachlamydiaceae bacterium]